MSAAAVKLALSSILFGILLLNALSAFAAPTNVAGLETPFAKVPLGVISHALALPIGGPLWLNPTIASNQPTNEQTTPAGFTAVAVSAGRDIIGPKESGFPVYISYARLPSSTQNLTVARTVVGIWADNDNWPDTKIAAVQLNQNNSTVQANIAIPKDVPLFTRTYSCATGDRVNPTKRAYFYIKSFNQVGDKNEVLSDRFSVVDNRWTATMSAAFYPVNCVFVSDQYNVSLPVRPESASHSDSLPVAADNTYEQK